MRLLLLLVLEFVISALGFDLQSENLHELLAKSPLAQIMQPFEETTSVFDGQDVTGYSGLPVVIAHGMGDSCFNPGMAQITHLVGKRLGDGVYSVCVGDGDSQPEDTINGFLMNLNKEVEFFAKKVAADPGLSKGFNAMGLSQGNLVIRGYIEKFNEPPVKNFISMHGPLAGVASIPHCNPSSGLVRKLCQQVTELVAAAAYTTYVQDLVAQANYLRIPLEIKEYLKTPFLPDLNNEVENSINSNKYKSNFESLESLVLIKAKSDTMIYPKESEWFGFFEDGGYEKLLTFRETKWYKKNLFGLKTLDEKNKVHFETTEGDHLRFTLDDLYGVLDKYWKKQPTAELDEIEEVLK